MDTPKNVWKGLRTIVVVRQSSDKDGTASTAAQLDYMRKELERVGLIYVDKEVLEGVSAAAPARITEVLEELFERKRKKKDFDVIAWQIEDRATRGGGEFGMWLAHEAKRRGLRIFFAGDDQFSGAYAPVVRVAKYESAKETSVNNGRRTSQGQKWAQQQGFFRTAGQTPIGCDRIYCGEDDKPKFIIHNLPNGLQEQRDYTTGAVIGRYGTVGKKSRSRFRKQRNEYSLLKPGDRQQRKTVRVIFYLRYKRGWRGQRIADYLNRNGILSPKGKQWSQRQVEIIYENEAYTGVTYNDQTYSGRFFRRDRELGFVALDRDEIELVTKKTFAPKLRPMDEWDRIDQPHMYDFLPRDVRDLAIAAQAKMWEERTNPARPPKKPTAYPASDYLLSGRLRAIQDGEALTGTMCGPADHKIPYYRHPRSRRGHRRDSVYNNMIPIRPQHLNANQSQKVSRVLCLYDNAGESFQPGKDTSGSPVTQHLAKSKVLMFLFDPTQDPRFREKCRKFSNDPQLTGARGTQRQETLLIEAATRVRRHANLPPNKKYERPLLVIIPKSDVWGPLLADEDLASEPILPNSVAGGVAAVDVQRIERVSQKLRALLLSEIPELVAAAEDFSKHVLYIPVSALGHSPLEASTDDGAKMLLVRPGDISPHWAAVPVLYMFAKWTTGLVAGNNPSSHGNRSAQPQRAGTT